MALQKGTRVAIKGLQSEAGAALNGLHGTILDYDKEKERWEVVVDEDSTQAKLLKACNLEVLPMNEASSMRTGSHPERSSSSTIAEPQRRRAYSWEPSRKSSAEMTATMQANLEIDRLRRTLQEWQTANQQWQAAYVQMQNQCVLLESENRHLREVVEVAESGPNMDARFIARLARQNWKLGHEVGLRSNDLGSDDEDGLAASPNTKTDEIEDDENDSGRHRRPEGVKRLKLRKKDPKDNIIPQIDGEAAESSQASSASSRGNAVREDRPASRQGSNEKVLDCKQAGQDNAEEGRLHKQKDPPQARKQGVDQTSGNSGSALSTITSTVASILCITAMAAFTIGRFTALRDGGDAEL